LCYSARLYSNSYQTACNLNSPPDKISSCNGHAASSSSPTPCATEAIAPTAAAA